MTGTGFSATLQEDRMKGWRFLLENIWGCIHFGSTRTFWLEMQPRIPTVQRISLQGRTGWPSIHSLLVCFIVLSATLCPIPVAAKTEQDQGAQIQDRYPAAFTKTVQGAERFENRTYFSMMASDGIRKVDAELLYETLKAAVSHNERYKALYFARLLTDLKPNIAATWSNRAQLADALGLGEEASACVQNAKDIQNRIDVPITGVLPGRGLQIKPSTLADWAAATALLSDGIASKEGRDALVGFKDSVSGIKQSTPEQVAQQDRSDTAAGISPTGPWADPAPVQLRHVLGNIFQLTKAEPMHYRTVSKGRMFAAIMMSGLAGMEQTTNPVGAQQSMQTGEVLAGQATQVPSHYTGGSYLRTVFEEAKDTAVKDQPKASGAYHTVGNPLPFLWASGGSTQPYFNGKWRSTQGIKVVKITESNLADINIPNAKQVTPPEQLQFPKLLSVCTVDSANNKSCSVPISLMELMLTPDDVTAFAPQIHNILVDLSVFRLAYDSPNLVLQVGNGGGNRFWGADSDGAIYQLDLSPTLWLSSLQ